MTWEKEREHIKAGAVIIDYKFEFPDGEIKPKWILILSDNIINDSYIYCLTTSQTHTYKNSFSEYLKTFDPAFGKDIIIELERIDLVNINKLETKYKNGDLKIKKQTISDNLLNQILDKILDSDRIQDYIKDWLGLF